MDQEALATLYLQAGTQGCGAQLTFSFLLQSRTPAQGLSVALPTSDYPVYLIAHR